MVLPRSGRRASPRRVLVVRSGTGLYHRNGRLWRFRSGITVRAASRSLLEERLRLEKKPNVRLLAGYEVLGLVPEANERIAGVRIRQAATLRSWRRLWTWSWWWTRADRAPERRAGWRDRLPQPGEEVVDARLGYATRWFKMPEAGRASRCCPAGRTTPGAARSAGWRAAYGRPP